MWFLTSTDVWVTMSEGSLPEGTVTIPGMSTRSRNGTSGFVTCRMMNLFELTPRSEPVIQLILREKVLFLQAWMHEVS